MKTFFVLRSHSIGSECRNYCFDFYSLIQSTYRTKPKKRARIYLYPSTNISFNGFFELLLLLVLSKTEPTSHSFIQIVLYYFAIISDLDPILIRERSHTRKLECIICIIYIEDWRGDILTNPNNKRATNASEWREKENNNIFDFIIFMIFDSDFDFRCTYIFLWWNSQTNFTVSFSL